MSESSEVMQGRAKDALTITLALVAAITGTAGYQKFNPPRPDPWTGTQARDQARYEAQRFDLLAERVRLLEISQAATRQACESHIDRAIHDHLKEEHR